MDNRDKINVTEIHFVRIAKLVFTPEKLTGNQLQIESAFSLQVNPDNVTLVQAVEEINLTDGATDDLLLNIRVVGKYDTDNVDKKIEVDELSVEEKNKLFNPLHTEAVALIAELTLKGYGHALEVPAVAFDGE